MSARQPGRVGGALDLSYVRVAFVSACWLSNLIDAIVAHCGLRLWAAVVVRGVARILVRMVRVVAVWAASWVVGWAE